jgi:hypothetical protein
MTSPAILCASENLYALYDLVGSVGRSGYKVTCACSLAKAAALAGDTEISAIVIAGVTIIPSSIKFIRPQIPILLLTSNTQPPVVVIGADLVIPQAEFRADKHLQALLSCATNSNGIHHPAVDLTTP